VAVVVSVVLCVVPQSRRLQEQHPHPDVMDLAVVVDVGSLVELLIGWQPTGRSGPSDDL
jgi:uncharacterized membrane protein YozB (DUF420 family)